MHHVVYFSPFLQLSEEADQAFVGEVFSGCARYQALIKVYTCHSSNYYAFEIRSLKSIL